MNSAWPFPGGKCSVYQWCAKLTLPYLSALEVCSRRGATQIHVYLTLPVSLVSVQYVSGCRLQKHTSALLA